MTEFWNRCHECEKKLTEPEDTPGLCAPCKLAGLRPEYHVAGHTLDWTETDGAGRALYTNPDPPPRNLPPRRRYS